MSLAPVAVFAYARPGHLQETLLGLLQNPEAERTDVHIFCDGPRSSSDTENVQKVRSIARKLRGVGSLKVVERDANAGLSRSITEGVSRLCNEYGRAIVLEDDIVPTKYFLRFMNDALSLYEADPRVAAIGGHTLSRRPLAQTVFSSVPDCWGWAVWSRSWSPFRLDAANFCNQIAKSGRRSEFDFDGSYPYFEMLQDCACGINQSWAVQWYAHVFLHRQLTLYPGVAVTKNIGADGSGTHGVSGNSLDIPVALAPISVSSIPVTEEPGTRSAWSELLRSMAGTQPFHNRVKRYIKRQIALRRNRA